jgi:hypothetical protein
MTRQAVDILGQCLALAVRDGRLVRNVAEASGDRSRSEAVGGS